MSDRRLLNIAKRWYKTRAAYFETVKVWRKNANLDHQAALNYAYSAWQAAEYDLAVAVAEWIARRIVAVESEAA